MYYPTDIEWRFMTTRQRVLQIPRSLPPRHYQALRRVKCQDDPDTDWGPISRTWLAEYATWGISASKIAFPDETEEEEVGKEGEESAEECNDDGSSEVEE
ncbi:hypothetical protein C8R44DRAFT_323368 [Mycena epipterygia]|nr:hypothetical protein C8R44DRAFT_323368 [Mycena epipterygia]